MRINLLHAAPDLNWVWHPCSRWIVSSEKKKKNSDLNTYKSFHHGAITTFFKILGHTSSENTVVQAFTAIFCLCWLEGFLTSMFCSLFYNNFPPALGLGSCIKATFLISMFLPDSAGSFIYPIPEYSHLFNIKAKWDRFWIGWRSNRSQLCQFRKSG